MNKNKILIFIIIFFNLATWLNSSSIFITAEVQNEIITNIDIEDERRYLLFLNPKLKNLQKNKIDKIAFNSLVTEIIKKKELKKFYNLDNQNKIIDVVEQSFLKSKNLKNKNEFKDLLKKKKLDYDLMRNKLQIEALWNRLVYEKYSKNLNINEVELRNNIINQFNSKKRKNEYNLSEILFTESVSEDFEIMYNKVIQSIGEIGFENSANIFSVSNTAKNGGLIGWINELQISEQINKRVINLNRNEISKPIKIRNAFIIIKLNDKKEIKNKINLEIQLEKLINLETNRQLNNFSTIFYKKLKKNLEINES